MADIELLERYRKNQLKNIETVLKKSSELIAFIKVYGALYDNYYNGLILNLNNINEHFLQSLNSQIIDGLYDVYSTAREQNKPEKETFEQLRLILEKLPVLTITEVSDRARRHK